MAPANQPANRTIDPPVRTAAPSPSTPQTGVVTLDVPLDPPPGAGLFIDKIARSRDAEIGGTVDYQVTVRNVAPIAVNGIQLLDTLPRGFTFVPGSARRQNATTPTGTPGIVTAIAQSDHRQRASN